jgi:hypothetical protein
MLDLSGCSALPEGVPLSAPAPLPEAGQPAVSADDAKPKKLSRSERMRRRMAAMAREIAALKAEIRELEADLDEEIELRRNQGELLKLYRDKHGAYA